MRKTGTSFKISAGFVAGSLVGLLVFATKVPPAPAALAAAQQSDSGRDGFPTNRRGQTYGEARAGSVPPDLIMAVADNGRSGYIRRSDWMPTPPRNPEEALALTDRLVNERGEIVIPVFAEDGVTVVGEFTAGIVTQGPEL